MVPMMTFYPHTHIQCGLIFFFLYYFKSDVRNIQDLYVNNYTTIYTDQP